MGVSEILLGMAFPLLIGLGLALAVLGDASAGEVWFARGCFILAGADLLGFVLWKLYASQLADPSRVALAGVAGLVIVPSLLYSLLWINNRAARTLAKTQPVSVVTPTPTSAPTSAPSTIITKPSLVFVFGAPLGDNDSATWIMMLRHYGPRTAYNCDIIFSDNDRKNIEHEWLVKHPNSPYPPPWLAGESQRRIQVQEAGPEGSVGSFQWNPINPNSQHYTVGINCRDGYFVEKWEIARVNGILRSAIAIEQGAQWVKGNPGKDPVVFTHQDPEFVRSALATEIPKATVGKVVHPGWKPKYTFEVPAAIIDPNGNVQVVSGIKQPDGSTLTDFGSWNILTRHYGD